MGGLFFVSKFDVGVRSSETNAILSDGLKPEVFAIVPHLMGDFALRPNVQGRGKTRRSHTLRCFDADLIAGSIDSFPLAKFYASLAPSRYFDGISIEFTWGFARVCAANSGGGALGNLGRFFDSGMHLRIKRSNLVAMLI